MTPKSTQRRLTMNLTGPTLAGPAQQSPTMAAMGTGGLLDTFGRVASDLRVSLTDRCNLRCSYCMPAEGLDWLPGDDVLTDDEVVRLVDRRPSSASGSPRCGSPAASRCCAGACQTSSRRTTTLRPRPETSITTNGMGLTRTAYALAAAGLDRVNVSLDTVRRRRLLHDHPSGPAARRHRGLQAAAAAGLGPVKVNAVLMRGVNDRQAPELLRWCMERGYELRFIEQMPLDAQHRWSRDTMITSDEIFTALQAEFSLEPAEEPRGSAPAELFAIDGGPATVGVIASVTRPFCGDCDRVRLTADGQVRNCLFAREESDLRAALRGGADDAEIADRWRAAMMTKRPGHGIDDITFLQPARPMSAIGG